jgi:hypothetical protein
MRILQKVICKLLCAGVALAGLLVIAGHSSRVAPLFTRVSSNVTSPPTWYVMATVVGIGVLFFLLGVLGLLPIGKLRARRRIISFTSAHGNVVIQLDPVEATLNRVVGKMPEVKKIAVHVLPIENECKVRIRADVLLYKGLGMSVRDISSMIAQYIGETAINLLGVNEVTTVDLNVRGIIPDQAAASQAPHRRAGESLGMSPPSAGHEPAGPTSRYQTPLRPVLPGQPLSEAEADLVRENGVSSLEGDDEDLPSVEADSEDLPGQDRSEKGG